MQQERRQRRDEWQAQGQVRRESDAGTWDDNGTSHQYPVNNPLFDRPVFTSPPTGSSGQIPNYAPPEPRRPSGFPQTPYEEQSHARERLDDPRYRGMHGRQQSESRPNAQARAGAPPYYDFNPGRDAARSYHTAPTHPRPYPAAAYRDTSVERAQEGRYPDPAPAPRRETPSGFMPFPSPQPRLSMSSSYDPNARPSPPRPPSRQTSRDAYPPSRPLSGDYTRSPPVDSPRPRSQHDDQGTFRPDYSIRAESAGSWSRPRSESAGGHTPIPPSPLSDDPRNPMDTMPGDLGIPNTDWLAIPRGGATRRRNDTGDSGSQAGTVYSDLTVRQGDDDDDSGHTAKAADWQNHINAMLAGSRDGTVLPYASEGTVRAGDDSDDEEATLWITAPSRPSEQTATRDAARPSLTVNTNPQIPLLMRGPATTPSDISTDSEGTGDFRISRAKSFARPNDPNQWHMRPEPDQLYAALDDFFPKIDLDKPIVDGTFSTQASTPASESPKRTSDAPYFPPPPTHPMRQPTLSPKSPEWARDVPPPLHPMRSTFNKAENRKSIRVMADHKRKTIARDLRDGPPPVRNIEAIREEEGKLERRRSSAMWGHKVVEVTPSRLLEGQLPTVIPEKSGEKPGTSYTMDIAHDSDTKLGQGRVDRQRVVWTGLYCS